MNFWYFSILFSIILVNYVKCSSDMENYDLMPPLHKHDSYWDCATQYKDKAVYCVAKTYLKPDNSSIVWKYVEHFSSQSRMFFRHDTVTRGICLNLCKEQMRQDATTRQKNYTVQKFDIDKKIYYPGIALDANTFHHRKVYTGIMNQCINREIFNEYGLESYSEIEYCTTAETEKFSVDSLDWFCLVVVSVLVVMTLWGTWYDIELRASGGLNPDHYRKFPMQSSRTILAFSLPRNWNQLVNHPESNNNSNQNHVDDFTYFEAIKVIVMLGNTVIHLYSVFSMIPTLDPDILETNSRSMLYRIFSGATFTNQIYLAIAGFLLTLAPAKQIKLGKVLTLSDFWDALQKRYLRLTPLHAFVILLEATWVSKIYNGAIWQQLAGVERASCRANWWTNMLYINNFVGNEEPCVLPTWYMATDMQLFILRFAFLMLISRMPSKKTVLFVLSSIIAILIPGHIIYKHALDGVYIGNVEAARYFFRYETSYQYFHIPFHASIGSYVFGMLAAFIYREVKDESIDIKQSKLFKLLWKMTIPLILFGAFVAPYMFSTFDFERPALWIAICGSFLRSMWGLLLGVIILGYSNGMGGQWRDFFNASFFKPLGKVNFGFYLTHMTMIKLIMGDMHDPPYLDVRKFVWLLFAITVLSYVSGAIVHLMVELPAANLQKEWQSKPKAVKEGQSESKKVN